VVRRLMCAGKRCRGTGRRTAEWTRSVCPWTIQKTTVTIGNARTHARITSIAPRRRVYSVRQIHHAMDLILYYVQQNTTYTMRTHTALRAAHALMEAYVMGSASLNKASRSIPRVMNWIVTITEVQIVRNIAFRRFPSYPHFGRI
jgi:hypothetical protein